MLKRYPLLIKSIFLSLCLPFLFGCFSANCQISLINDLPKPSWIGDAYSLPLYDSLFCDEDLAPLILKTFTVEDGVSQQQFTLQLPDTIWPLLAAIR